MVEVSYRRELSHNYMIIEAAETEADSYECRMLTDNVIEGLLRFRVRYHENHKEYYYEITSKQPLSRILEQRHISGEEIRSLMLGMAAALHRTEEYLLKEEQILLEPEYIYIAPDSFSVYFCLVPGYQGDFPAGVTALLAYLLGKVNHQDKEGVILAYNLYHESLKENYGMTDLLERLSLERETVFEEPTRIFAAEAETFAVSREEEEIPQVYEDKTVKVAKEGKKEREKHSHTRLLKKTAVEFLITGAIIEGLLWFLGGSALFQQYGIWLGAAVMLLFGLSFFKKRRKSSVKPIKRYTNEQKEGPEPSVLKEKPCIDWTTEEESDNMERYSSNKLPEEPETVLLFSQEDASASAVLESLDREQENIRIPYVPFVIGKHREMSDYCLLRATVSRLHLKVDKREGVYIITDLNSTNGTMVDGYHLQANETVSIKNGDMIYLADIGYRFIEA